MPRHRTPPLFPAASPFLVDPLGWFRVATNAAEIFQNSAQVIMQRTAMMSTMGVTPTRAERYELGTMVQEKTDAAMEAMTAMSGKASQIYARATMDLGHRILMNTASLWGWPVPASTHSVLPRGARTAAAAVVDAGLAPYRRRSSKNASRLNKRRR